MKQLDINFAGGKFRYWRRRAGERYTLSCLLAAAGVACCAGLAITTYSQIRERGALIERAANLNRRLAATLPSPVMPARSLSPATTEAITAAINTLNIPWRDLFDSIEQATPNQVALISLEPDAAKKTLVLIGEASNAGAMLDYLGQLKSQPLFTQVLLVKHEINKQDPYAPYRFQFEARWKEPAP
jgi:Tfp pilus assembly protein PilN